MSLPETIWWCEEHESRGLPDRCDKYAGYEFNDWISWEVVEPCRMVEVELHPVGTRVAGRNDLLIRRDKDGNWPLGVMAMLDRAIRGRLLDDPWKVQHAVEVAVLAVAEGGETDV